MRFPEWWNEAENGAYYEGLGDEDGWMAKYESGAMCKKYTYLMATNILMIPEWEFLSRSAGRGMQYGIPGCVQLREAA